MYECSCLADKGLDVNKYRLIIYLNLIVLEILEFKFLQTESVL